LAVLVLMLTMAVASAGADEGLYRTLSQTAKGQGDPALLERLAAAAVDLDWSGAPEAAFEGNLRLIKAEGAAAGRELFLLRDIQGALHILAPAEAAAATGAPQEAYADLPALLGNKLTFRAALRQGEVDGKTYSFARLLERPAQLAFDRVFKLCIVLMLFFVMAGMGLTLTVADFKLVFQKPRGMIAGAVLQWAVMPLVAVALGRLMGFYEAFPFIYVGMVLIAVSPGGVTSNLMTYYAKGDLALSISLTSFSTVLALFFTPLLLALYCANVPEVNIPVGLVVQTITVLVLIPLALGMGVRSRWSGFARRATPFFSALGLLALLFLIGAGILSHVEMFADTTRYGVRFYSMVFLLTLAGMAAGGVIPRLLAINTYQTRAISLETGLRNASLAMAMALLIQDYMGDFHSSMFFTAAMFGLLMYVAGFASIWVYPRLLPLPAHDGDGPPARV